MVGQEPTDTTKKEVNIGLIAAGILVTVLATAMVTVWLDSRSHDHRPIGNAVAATPAATPQPRPRPAVFTPADLEVFHHDVFFESKSARLRADAVRVLQEAATLIDQTGAWIVLVQGHADRSGTAEYNRLLALRRAEAVKQFLVELGVPDGSVKVVAVGQEGTVCDAPTPDCQKLNRRVHLEIRKLPPAALVSVGPAVVDTATIVDR